MHTIRDAVRGLAADLASGADSVGQLLQHLHRGAPVDAGVGDADAALEARGTIGWDLLVALVKVRFDHDADDAVLAFAELVTDDLCDLGLVLVVFLRVA